MQEAFVAPARLTLFALHGPKDAARLDAQFNPEELSLGIKAVYKDETIAGMSHQLKQYSHTDNISLKFSLLFMVSDPANNLDVRKPLGMVGPNPKPLTIMDRQYAERFLLSLCVPRGEMLVTRNMPPSVLVLWPNFLTFEGVVTDVNFKYTRFNRKLAPTQFEADLTMDQLRDIRFTSDGVRKYGHGFTDDYAVMHGVAAGFSPSDYLRGSK